MGKIVSIHSFRGGTGKSNLTANVAARVAMAGKRVAIVDTDIQSPGIHVLFGLDNQTMVHSLNQYLHDELPIADVAFDIGAAAANDSLPGRRQLAGCSLWLVPSSIDGAEIARVLKEGYDVMRLNRGMMSLLKDLKLDYLFLDTHPGLNQETMLSVAISDVLIIILRPDQQDFQGTAVTVDVARSLDVPDMMLVVNKLLEKYPPEETRAYVEQTYGVPVAAVLPLSEDMADLGSADLFSLCHPEHRWSQGIQQVADRLLAL